MLLILKWAKYTTVHLTQHSISQLQSSLLSSWLRNHCKLTLINIILFQFVLIATFTIQPSAHLNHRNLLLLQKRSLIAINKLKLLTQS